MEQDTARPGSHHTTQGQDGSVGEADSTGGRAGTPQSQQLLSPEVFIFTFTMTLAGRHSQKGWDRERDKECSGKETNCTHGDKSLRKALLHPVPHGELASCKLIFLIACLETLLPPLTAMSLAAAPWDENSC